MPQVNSCTISNAAHVAGFQTRSMLRIWRGSERRLGGTMENRREGVPISNRRPTLADRCTGRLREIVSGGCAN